MAARKVSVVVKIFHKTQENPVIREAPESQLRKTQLKSTAKRVV